MSKLLFVYGSLKKGGWANSRLLNQKFIGTAKTTKNYKLYAGASYPMLVEEEDSNKALEIEGELYEIDEDLIPSLDRFEGVPSLYKRAHLSIQGYEGQEIIGYLYANPVSGLRDCGTSWEIQAARW